MVSIHALWYLIFIPNFIEFFFILCLIIIIFLLILGRHVHVIGLLRLFVILFDGRQRLIFRSLSLLALLFVLNSLTPFLLTHLSILIHLFFNYIFQLICFIFRYFDHFFRNFLQRVSFFLVIKMIVGKSQFGLSLLSAIVVRTCEFQSVNFHFSSLNIFYEFPLLNV